MISKSYILLTIVVWASIVVAAPRHGPYDWHLADDQDVESDNTGRNPNPGAEDFVGEGSKR